MGKEWAIDKVFGNNCLLKWKMIKLDPSSSQ